MKNLTIATLLILLAMTIAQAQVKTTVTVLENECNKCLEVCKLNIKE